MIKCGNSCGCGRVPCTGGINQKHWLPNQLRCKTCECCIVHRKLDPETGRKVWNNGGRPNNSGGCCGRHSVPCPHVDPTQNQDSAKLGNDDSFMDRDVDESRFDDFEEPMSESAGRWGSTAGGGSRVSSRRQNKEARHLQNVAQARQQMRAGASGRASPHAPIILHVMSKKTGNKGMGFLRSGPGQPLPAGFRNLTSPAAAAQPQTAAAAASSQQRSLQRGQHAAGRKEVAKVDPQVRQQQLQAQKQRQASLLRLSG